jgi:Tfp pilus assembly protein PilX
MIARQKRKPKSSERGIALVVALLTLLLVSALLMGMIVASNSETNISGNFRDEQTAFFAARAGIEEVRDRIRQNANPTLATNTYFTAGLGGTTPLAGAPNGILYVINPANGETVDPWNSAGKYYDDELIREIGTGPTAGEYILPAPSSSGNSYAATPPLPWKWVRLMIKPNKSATGITRITSVDGAQNANRVCFNGTHEYTTAATTCPDKPVYELTALAVTPSGSRRMIQYEVSQGSFPPIPGAIVFDGPTPAFSAPNSNSFSVSGTDVDQGPNNGANCPAAANVPAVGGYNAAAATALTSDATRPASYTSGVTATPAISNVSSQLGVLNTVDGLQALVNNVTSAAASNIYGASPLPNPSTLNIGSIGPPINPVINVVQGDYTLSGSTTGSGILLVTGNLTFSGNPTYDGLILVIGEGTVTKNGGGNGTLNGALLVANMFDGSGNPIPLGAGNAPGAPSITWNGGGTASFNYDSCWVNYGSRPLPFRTITDRELIY